MFIVYLVTNLITKKKYVGVSSLTIEKRRYNHYYATTRGSMLLFHKALRKYEPENWVWEIKITTDSIKEAKRMEQVLIQEYDTHYNNGYNMTIGGDGMLGYNHTKETKQKISKSLIDNKYCLGYKHTPDAKENMRRGQLGRKHTESTRIKMSQSMKGLKRSKQARKNMSKAQSGIQRTSPKPIEIVDMITGFKEFPKSLKLWCLDKGYKYSTVYMSIKRTGKYKCYNITHRSKI